MNNIIRREVKLEAPIHQVWQAIADHQQFGEWFGVKITEPFKEGTLATGPITHKGMENVTWNAIIQKIQPETYFSYTWHPYAIDPKVDYSQEKPTLVEFSLVAFPTRTRLTLTETGFADLPEARGHEAWLKHEGGWLQQMLNIENYLKSK